MIVSSSNRCICFIIAASTFTKPTIDWDVKAIKQILKKDQKTQESNEETCSWLADMFENKRGEGWERGWWWDNLTKWRSRCDSNKCSCYSHNPILRRKNYFLFFRSLTTVRAVTSVINLDITIVLLQRQACECGVE